MIYRDETQNDIYAKPIPSPNVLQDLSVANRPPKLGASVTHSQHHVNATIYLTLTQGNIAQELVMRSSRTLTKPRQQ
jgi:hypothetical protein